MFGCNSFLGGVCVFHFNIMCVYIYNPVQGEGALMRAYSGAGQMLLFLAKAAEASSLIRGSDL